MTIQELIDTWRKKREFLLEQEVYATDAAAMFKLRRDIDDAENRIKELLAAPPHPHEPPVQLAPPPEAQAYLAQLAESYRWLELQGIREAGTLRIELEKVYVALKAEPESEYDRQQAADLHYVEVREAAGVTSLDAIDPGRLEEFDAANIRLTYRPGKEEAKRATVTEVRTVGDAFRQHRRIVILGGPGSGKSTLGRWLALQFARALLQQLDSGVPVHVKVPVSQIDPDPRTIRDPNELVNLGPARLPIFLRIAHFARELAERERQQCSTLSLIDYLGHDPDSCSLSDSTAKLNAMFQSFLEAKQAVVVLDGLDELSSSQPPRGRSEDPGFFRKIHCEQRP